MFFPTFSTLKSNFSLVGLQCPPVGVEGRCLISLEMQLLQDMLDEFCRGQRCHIGWGSCIGSIESLGCNSIGTAGTPVGL